MEAPEKLYVDTDDRLSDSILYGFTEKRKDDDIEYTRTDAFIKKASKWFEESLWKHVYGGQEKRDNIFVDFKKYMEN